MSDFKMDNPEMSKDEIAEMIIKATNRALRTTANSFYGFTNRRSSGFTAPPSSPEIEKPITELELKLEKLDLFSSANPAVDSTK